MNSRYLTIFGCVAMVGLFVFLSILVWRGLEHDQEVFKAAAEAGLEQRFDESGRVKIWVKPHE